MTLLLAPILVAMQPASRLPFASGERLTYSVHAGPGLNGRGEMWIEGPVDVHGVAGVTLNSEITGGFGPFRASNRSTSWFDLDRLATMRFAKTERSPFSKQTEDIEITSADRSWKAADGRSGRSESDQPLDELSFIYVLRTLDIPDDSTVVLNRHFDAARNPTVIRSLGKGSVQAGEVSWTTRDYEMRVRDARHYRGEGVLRISLSDDACRRPVRIESTMPNAGTVVLTLQAALPAIAACER